MSPSQRGPIRRRQDAPAAATLGPPAGQWGWPAILVLSVAVAYANSLGGAFVLDDQASIVQNPAIQDLSNLSAVLNPGADSPVAGRPLASLSFALSYAVGGLNVTGYHLVSVLLHMACALVAFALVRRTAGLSRMPQAIVERATAIAGVAVLLWAVHPLNSEVVAYATQRTESLAAVFVLLVLYASLRAATSLASAHEGRRWRIVAVVASVLGIAAKESSAIAPVLVVLFDRAFLYDSWREALRARRGFYAALAATWFLAAALVAAEGRAAVAGFSTGVSSWTYLLNQAAVIAGYFRRVVWPTDLVALYGWPVDVALSDVALPFAALACAALATVVAFVLAPRLGYLGAWFFITLAPASSIVPVATEVGAERRMYLPLIALTVLAVVGVVAAIERMPRSRGGGDVATSAAPWRAAMAVLGVVTLALAWTTSRRNLEYASPLVLTRTVVERRPTALAHHAYGEQLLLVARADDGIAELRAAVAKGNSRAGYQLGAALVDAGRRDEALQVLAAFVATANPPAPLVPRWLVPSVVEVVTARGVMAQVFAERQQWDAMAEHATEMLRMVPSHPRGRRFLADARFGQARWAEAATEYRTYVSGRGASDAVAWMNLGIAHAGTEQFDDAVRAFERADALAPGNAQVQRLLAIAREDRARVNVRR